MTSLAEKADDSFVREWMEEFYHAGDIVDRDGFVRTSDGLYRVWDEQTRTGFVFGDAVHTGQNYATKIVQEEERLTKLGFSARRNVSASDSQVRGFMYSRRAA